MKDVSVIIPTFNRLWALPQAIDSCLSAGRPAVEVIVVDDGSTDGTWEFLRDRADIAAVRTPNWGKDWAVQTALQAASAIYREPAFVHRHHRLDRLQRHRGLRQRLAHYTNVQVMRKAIGLLERQGGATPRRKRAAAAYLWPIVRDLAKSELDEASAAADWLLELAPDYTPPVQRVILADDEHLGFRTTERLIRLWALFRKPPPGPVS